MNTTEPNNLHVPPCLSTWSIRRICRKRIPRMADVANTCPLEPSVRTTIEATTTIKSGTGRESGAVGRMRYGYSPMMQMGLRMKRSRPQKPMYLDRQPADHRRTRYSTPKNTTRHISCNRSTDFLLIKVLSALLRVCRVAPCVNSDRAERVIKCAT